MGTEYELVFGTTTNTLEQKINERIALGWEPVGGIAVVSEKDTGKESSHILFVQAVWKPSPR